VKLTGKMIELSNEMRFIGNIEEGGEGSLNLGVISSFEYDKQKLIILCDSDGNAYGFTYDNVDELMILTSVEDEKLEDVVNYVLNMIVEDKCLED